MSKIAIELHIWDIELQEPQPSLLRISIHVFMQGVILRLGFRQKRNNVEIHNAWNTHFYNYKKIILYKNLITIPFLFLVVFEHFIMIRNFNVDEN